MKQKRILSTLLLSVIAMAFCGNLSASYAADAITVTVDGQNIIFDQPPINIDGRVMVPVRAVAEKMGWYVTFEKSPNKQIINRRMQEESHVLMQKSIDSNNSFGTKFGYTTDIALHNHTITLRSDGADPIKNSLVAKPVVKNGRTLLGIRDIANGLYADIQWDSKTQTVAITTKPMEQFPNYENLLQYMAENEKTPEKTNIAQNSPNINRQEFAEKVVELVNEERAKEGLPALQTDAKLINAAQIRANEIRTSFSHTRPDGTTCFTILEEVNIPYGYAGENIAYGQTSPEQVMQAWLNSEGHRKNILSKDFRSIGVGYAADGNCWVQLFIG